jgi:hypothetical protein
MRRASRIRAARGGAERRFWAAAGSAPRAARRLATRRVASPPERRGDPEWSRLFHEHLE